MSVSSNHCEVDPREEPFQLRGELWPARRTPGITILSFRQAVTSKMNRPFGTGILRPPARLQDRLAPPLPGIYGDAMTNAEPLRQRGFDRKSFSIASASPCALSPRN
jgi:hypothetical protein